jgi:hypothetical protein
VPEGRKLFALKLALTIPIAAAMVLPLLSAEGRANVLGTLAALGWWVFGAIVLAFLVAIALYCLTLQRLLERIAPANRAMAPRGVWLMFVPFYNIVEDFFIIRGVTASLGAEARVNPALSGFRRFGAISGYGWCAAQVLALIPGHWGELASLVALLLWLWHWVFIGRALRRMAQDR